MWQKAPYRTLALVYGLALLAGLIEYFSGKPREPDIYGNPQRNFPEAMSRLYPGSSESEYLLGRHFEAAAGRNYRPEEASRNKAMAEQFIRDLNANLREAARHYERAIELGLKSEENLYYNYALTLMRTQADPKQIDRAIALWKQNFPYSTRTDLEARRASIEEQLKKLKPSATATDADPVGRAVHFEPEWKSNPEYVGSESCRECHQKEFESYLQTRHSRALAEVSPDEEPPDAVYDHPLSGRRFRVLRDNGQLIQQESLLLDDGSEFPLTTAPLKYRVGSGHFARTYLVDGGGGFLFESPVTWYESAQSWSMTPGFDKKGHRSFSRHAKEDCLFCHSGQVSTSTVSNFRVRLVENSIGCEKCHGPGAAHVKSQRQRSSTDSAADDIVNPAKLSRGLSDAVCQQCHLQGEIQIAGRNRQGVDFRPGQALEQFATIYRLRTNETGMTVVGHVEQLDQSPCYQKSNSLKCATCHDPHATVPPARQVEHYRAVCMSCHTQQPCRLELSEREQRAANDCVQCHMPKSATEVPHLAFTHHHIGIHPLVPTMAEGEKGQLVALSAISRLSEEDRTRSQMLARFEMYVMRGREFQRSTEGRELARRFEEWLTTIPEGADPETDFARAEFYFSQGNHPVAVRHAERILESNSLNSGKVAILLDQLGQFDFDQNRVEKSRMRFGNLVLLRQQGMDWFHLGMTEQRLGNSLSAIKALETSRRLQPAAIAVYETLAEEYRSRSDIEAEKQLRQMISKLRQQAPTEVSPR